MNITAINPEADMLEAVSQPPLIFDFFVTRKILLMLIWGHEIPNSNDD